VSVTLGATDNLAARDDGDPAGYVAAYGLPVDERLGDRLAEVWSLTARDTWTALELDGTANTPTVAVVCAFRTDDAPAKAPLPGLEIQRGLQQPLLMALDPRAVDRFDVDAVPLPDLLLDHLGWRVSIANSLLVEQTHL
jgi:type VII secretion protein EccE